MARWPLSLRAAINTIPILTIKDAAWREGRLSDLAFAVSTRLGYLPDIIRVIDESLYALGLELAGKDAEINNLRAEGSVYTFGDYRAVRKLLIGAGSFITESRSCFENLACFYREFLRNYFEEMVSVASSYAIVAHMASTEQWADDLQRIRHDLLHERSMWLAFEVRSGQTPRYEPLLLLNWRPGRFQPDDCVPFQVLRDIRAGLAEAAAGLQESLVRRVSVAK